MFTRQCISPAFAGMHGPPSWRVLLFLGYLSSQMVEIHGARIASHQHACDKKISVQSLCFTCYSFEYKLN